MEATEVRKLAALEDDHWWYRERRHILARDLRGMTPGVALDIGAAGGGNSRVLRDLGWKAIPLEYGAPGAEVAAERGLSVIRADATRLPIADGALDLVVAYDVLEHIADDEGTVEEVMRVLRPHGRFLVAVPCDPKLWSEHDVAVDHLRRYTRETLTALLDRPGLELRSMTSWNVLLRPVVALRRKKSSGSDLEELNPVVNFGLRSIVTAERYVPGVKKLPGVTLFADVRRV